MAADKAGSSNGFPALLLFNGTPHTEQWQMTRDAAIERLNQLERAIDLMTRSVTFLDDWLTGTKDRKNGESIAVMNGDPIDRLRILADDVISIWPNAPAIFRDLPVAFGGIQALSYTECMVGFAWDLALTLSTLIEISETGIFLVEWERLKSIFDSYPAPSGFAPPAKQQKFHAVALAAVAEIMRERQRLMLLPKTVRGGFENSTRRHSSLFGPITNRHHEWAYARDCAIVDGSSDLTYVQGAVLSEAQFEILSALKEGIAAGLTMTLDVLAQAAKGSRQKDGEFERQYRPLVRYGYIEPGPRGPNHPEVK